MADSRATIDPPVAPFRWDTRWNAAEREAAVRIANEGLAAARRRLDQAAKDIQRYADWVGTAYSMKARADVKESGADA